MVHGKGDTNHGAANPPSSEERARRNPTARITGLLLPRHYPPGSTRETSPAASKSLDTSSGAGHLLCSHTSRERGQEALSPVPHSPHTPQPLLSWGLGAEPAPNTAPWGWATRARTDGKGGQQGLTLPAAVLAPLMFPVCCRGVPSAPPRGNEGGWRETEALGEAREHTSIDTAAGHRPPASLGAKSQL